MFTGNLDLQQAEELSKRPGVQSIELDQHINIHDHVSSVELDSNDTGSAVPLKRRANLSMPQDDLNNRGAITDMAA